MKKIRSLESYFSWLLIAICLPATLLAIVIAWHIGVSPYLIGLGAGVQLIVVVFAAFHLHQRLSARLRALSSIVEAAKNGDYAIKARSENHGSALADLVDAVNALSEELSHEKIHGEEKRALLNKVVEQINVGVITATLQGEILSLNSAACGLLNLPSTTAPTTLAELPCPIADAIIGSGIVNLANGNMECRIFIQRHQYREGGQQRRLILLTAMDQLLRQEQFKSWEELVRVISHEINNSLAPIKSLSESMISLIQETVAKEDDKHDLIESSQIIGKRAASLTTFIAQYRNLTRLENPVLSATSLRSVIESIVPLFKKNRIEFICEEECTCEIDQSHIQQALINLIKNAVEAMDSALAYDTKGKIQIRLSKEKAHEDPFAKVTIEDSGSGINNAANLFVPFYTTKPGGTGIGLVLSREIIERHNGRLVLENLPEKRGAVATIRLPALLEGGKEPATNREQYSG